VTARIAGTARLPGTADVPKATAQEVGAAVSRNPLCILIPCHRVIGSTGKLTGYAGGLKRKQGLLELERATVLPGRSAS
jgi:O-6-methylguanine DNA methyltransferase